MPLTLDLGRFAAGLTYEKLPSEAVEIARTGIIDAVATMIAGAHDPAPQLLRKALDPMPGPASLYFSGESATAPEAAWINGTAGHALDYDDVGCRGHVSTVLFPAILAEAETLGLGGREIASAQVHRARGHAELPLGEAELFDKFRTCLDAGHARIATERLFDGLRRLETISARELTAVG